MVWIKSSRRCSLEWRHRDMVLSWSLRSRRSRSCLLSASHHSCSPVPLPGLIKSKSLWRIISVLQLRAAERHSLPCRRKLSADWKLFLPCHWEESVRPQLGWLCVWRIRRQQAGLSGQSWRQREPSGGCTAGRLPFSKTIRSTPLRHVSPRSHLPSVPPGQQRLPAMHRSLQASWLSKRFQLPPQPPYTKASHLPDCTLKKNLGSEALQGPGSALWAQTWPASGGTGPAGRRSCHPALPSHRAGPRGQCFLVLGPDLQETCSKQAAMSTIGAAHSHHGREASSPAKLQESINQRLNQY